jgi:hypothetical protein
MLISPRDYQAAGERKEQLHRGFVKFDDEFMIDVGVAMPREYLVTIGTRR